MRKTTVRGPSVPDRADAYGDPLPCGAIARLGSMRGNHGGSGCKTVTFSRGGEFLASNDLWSVRTWDAASLKELRHIEQPRVYCFYSGIALASDGRWVAVSNWDHTVRVLSLRSGRLLETFRGHKAALNAVAVSPDDLYVASGGDDRTIRVWSLRTGRLHGLLAGHTGPVMALAFSTTAETLASAGEDRGVLLWNPVAKKRIAVLRGHEKRVDALSFSPDGSLLASGGWDCTVRLWDALRRKPSGIIGTHDRWVTALAWSPDGCTLASGSHDRTVRIWDVSSRTLLHTLREHHEEVTSLAFSPDGHILVSGSNDGVLRRWSVRDGKRLEAPSGHEHGVHSVVCSQAGDLVASAGSDNVVRLWQAATGLQKRAVRADAGFVWGKNVLAMTSDGRMVASTHADGRVRVWRSGSGELACSFPATSPLAFSPDGKALATGCPGRDFTVAIWNLRTKRVVRGLAHDARVTALCYSPDGRLLVSHACGGLLRVWDASRGTLSARFDVGGRFGTDTSLWVSADGRRIGVASVDAALIWDTRAGETTVVSDAAQVFRFHPGGEYLLTCPRRNRIDFCTVGQRKRVLRLEGHTPSAVAFAREGRLLFTASHDHTVLVWDLEVLASVSKTLPPSSPSTTGRGRSRAGNRLRVDRPSPRRTGTKKRPITEADLASLEARHEFRLPPDYRAYLLEHGTTVPDPSFFWIKRGKDEASAWFEHLYGPRRLGAEFPDGKVGGPPDLLPIGDDGMEYTICIGIRGTRYGSIWVLNYGESDWALKKVASSFVELLGKLQPFPQE